MSWKDTLAKVAPVLAGALGSPLAGVAVKAGLDMLGIEGDESTLEEIVMRSDPDALLKLKQAEHNFKTTLRELDIKEKELNVGDRDSARQLAKTKGIWPQLVLSSAYSIAYGVVLYCFMSGLINVPEDQVVLFGSLIGVLTAAQVQVLNFWFGSSSGSKEKTNAMSEK